ncbi:MAG: YecA family protein [Acidimicrobiales bacterium]
MDPERAAFLFGAIPDGFDADDPDDRAELLSSQGEGLSPASLTAREILGNQIADDDPPEVWATARRLLALGIDRVRVMSELGLALGKAIRLSLESDDRSFDMDEYVGLLGNLPLPQASEIETAVVEVVRDHQAISFQERDRLVVESLGRSDDDEVARILVDRVTDTLVDDDGPLALLPGDRTVHVGDLTAGLVATHRITDEERHTGDLVVSFDLAGFARRDGLRLADGGVVEVVDDVAGDLAWTGPVGWLDGFAPGALVGVQVDAEGIVTIEEVDEVPAVDEGLVGLLRAVYDEAVAEPWLPVGAEDLVLGVLTVDGGAFDHPGPPLAELCRAAGLERRGDVVAHDASVWSTGAELRRTWRVFEALDDQDDRETALRALAVADDPVPSSELLIQVLIDLADPAVANLVADVLVDPDEPDPEAVARVHRFADALVGAASTPRQIAVSRWLAAVVAERTGEVLVADAHLKIAVAAGTAWGPLVERAAWYASDRGDAATALRLLRQLAQPNADDVETLVPFTRAAGPRLGRNDACWCGSGRKYKTCHLGQPQAVPLADRVGWLCRKAVAYTEHHGGDAALLILALAMVRSVEPSDVEGHDVEGHDDEGHDVEAMVAALADPIVVDAALTEGGWFVRFLAERGPLLPDDEALLAESWSLVARTVYEVLDVAPGRGLEVRDLRTGDRLEVRERAFSEQAGAGQLVCARAVPDGETHQFVGGLFPVAPGYETAVLDLCDEGDPAAICEWVAGLYRPPTLHTREGEPMVTCTAVVDPGDPTVAEEVLDRLYHREGQGWVEMHPIDEDEEIMRAYLCLEGDRLRISTHSEPRMDRVLALLAGALPTSRVLDDERVPLRPGEMPVPPPWLPDGSAAPDAPERAEVLAGIQEQLERRWTEEPVPALAGLTPHQAAADPTRRAELQRLIASFPDADELPAAAIIMRPDRLRDLLGLSHPPSPGTEP